MPRDRRLEARVASRGSRGRRRAGRAYASSPRAEAEGVLELRAARRAPGARSGGATRDRRAARSRASGAGRAAARRRRARPSRRSASRSSRSCTRNRSAMPPSRASASSLSNAIGSSERLPDVITSGRPRGGEQEVVERRVGEEEPDERAVRARPRGASARVRARRRQSTIGRSTDGEQRLLGAPSIRERVAPRRGPRTITASGFSSRRLRSRSARTAADDVASQARWNPPRPFTATIRPARERARRRRAIGSARRRPARPSGRAAASARAARAGRRSAGRGSAGRAGRSYSRAARRAHRERAPSSSRRGRRARRARS